ncbi:hypothetical protein ACFVWY_02195, partial [Streptomyces sp. NPDC058195]
QLIGSLLGLTWASIRTRITQKGIPEQALTTIETSVPVAKKLATEGPAGAVSEITAEAGDLKATILEKLTTYLIPTVLIAGITWILSLLNPASAFIRAVKGIIDIVTFIVTQGAQIADFVNAVLDAVITIANGGAAGVPKMIETALATSIPLLIGFLASILGISGLANKVKSVFHTVSKPVTRAIDKIINLITKKGKALWNKLREKKKKEGEKKEGKPSPLEEKENRLQKAIQAAVDQVDAIPGENIEKREIDPTLSPIRSKYSLTRLYAALKGSNWVIFGEINPKGNKKSKKKGKEESKNSEALTQLAENNKGKCKAVAILRTVGGGIYEGKSMKNRPKSSVHPEALKEIQRLRKNHHLGCAEIECISEAYREKERKEKKQEEYNRRNRIYETVSEEESNPARNGSMEAAKAEMDNCGDVYMPCDLCKLLLSDMGIRILNR